MPVTIRNYMFPIIFAYKGWIVTLNDASSFFQSSDVKVKVSISIDRRPYYTMSLNTSQQLWQYRRALNKSPQTVEQYKKISHI